MFALCAHTYTYTYVCTTYICVREGRVFSVLANVLCVQRLYSNSLLGPNDDFIVQQIRHVCS